MLTSFLDQMFEYIWSTPLLILVMGVGLWLTYLLKGLQFRYLGYALRLALLGDKRHVGHGDISHFQSLMTALAATIGIGNIAGVSTALTVGGLGALFWMWVTALIGMATKYGEAVLAVKFRGRDRRGEMCGGPMYFIARGLGWRSLAASFAIFGAVAAFAGGNMLQSNSVADIMQSALSWPPILTCCVLAVVVGSTLWGGIKSVGRVAGVLVPVMAALYIGGALLILVYHIRLVPGAFLGIFDAAFSSRAAAGGAMGVSVVVALQAGVSRGLMTSESGLGTASIAAAAAKTDCPGTQGLVSMTGSFIATIVMCTLTGLVLIVTGVLGSVDAAGGGVTGASLTLLAFKSVFPWSGMIVTISSVLFAVTTLLGWAYYGEKCIEFLFGERAIPFYRVLFVLAIIPGGLLDLLLVWRLSDITNALMAIPNLIGLAALSGVILRETKEFLTKIDAEIGADKH